ncbi:aminoglycoside phosphotransferase [Beutenbergia cavernae DSM 12333]|uniref:Aminoglycoside phosphotransferase n=1 Tax=Beutenbergia cavernae (strain ATCC BAA-8 / DSM 12333 / CCUG 43141 / JCM 11478 / NBRC 16432 / NCIMB 13614 / HKI 0122) TaxID=471853 RepID=C5C0W0_BEUC1|nr:phosphotransferase [Beutenbergia cavernae]ACQ79364.1 aminoglycoside phosphotransferase [Beutenbergia cavernae DSM 12333]
MKTLPDNPNLDHLRRQAKDLLAGLRDQDPTTTLAAAQAALAQQYGFRTWPDLKTEVDRLRGTADVADPSLAAVVAERFDLGAMTSPMASVQRADDLGRLWSLETDGGRWAVRSAENWWPIVPAERDVELQEAAAAAGVQLPAPVRSRAGAVVEEIDGVPWRVTTWRHSAPPLAAPVSALSTRRVGAVLATIHGLRLEVDRVSPWHEARFADEPWADVAARARAAGVSWADAFAAAVPTLDGLASLGEAPVDAGSAVLTHNSLGPAKVRREHDGTLVVAGWEHAGGQPPAWELADALATWSIDPGGAVNVAGARALVEGYASVADGVPALDDGSFRGHAMSICNYVMGEVGVALDAHAAASAPGADAPERDFADRNVTHLLTHLSGTPAFAQLLDVAALVH